MFFFYNFFYCVICGLNYYYLNKFNFIKLVCGFNNFLCIFCLIKLNILFFNNLYYEKVFFKNIFIKILKNIYRDYYENFLYCYFFCFNCFFYFKNFYFKNFNNNIFCEFKKILFYKNLYDFYDFYIYCFNNLSNCFYCLNYYNFFFNFFYFYIKKKYYNEFFISYEFYKNEENNFNILTPEEIFFFLDKYIIGQINSKKLISVSIYNHYKRIKLNNKFDYNLLKSNILMIGPSGSGKTFLIKTLSKILNIPMVVVDATTLTEAGYVGEDVDNIIQKLFINSFFDIDHTEIGLVFIDEIDKITSKNISSNNRDISGQGVQQALLKILEGKTCSVSYYNDFGEPLFFDVNTEDILFICGGAFPGLYENFEKNIEDDFYDYNFFDSDKLVNYGLISEFVGRFPIIIKFEDLSVFFLKKILFYSENSLINYYNNLFILENVFIFLSESSIDFISTFAFKKKLGSRGLRNILDSILSDLMFKIPNLENLSLIIIHNFSFFKESNGFLLRYDI